MLNAHAALTPDMAIGFEKAFGVSAAALLRMQSAHDLAQAKRDAATMAIERYPEPA